MSRILGYTDRLSVRAGERIGVKVSCDGLAQYDARLVRVIQGDINPAGPGFREEPIPVALVGTYQGRYQPIHTGSFALVEDNPVFKQCSSLTAQMLVWPTLPGSGEQTLMSRENPNTGQGFRCFLDADGAFAFSVRSANDGGAVVSTGKPLVASRWYLVTACHDAETGMLMVLQAPLDANPHVNDHGIASAKTGFFADFMQFSEPLFIAARQAVDRPVRECFNGRIEAPRLLSRSLQPSEAQSLVDCDSPGVITVWDFSVGISSQRIVDTGPNNLHGTLFNLPTRGVAGHLWNGEEHCWSRRPDHYAAIHFHDDDLYDCGWDTDFTLDIPLDLPSAVYAFHLQAEGESFYLPFAVRPPRGKVTAPLAFLLPTASYMAYANNRIGIDVPETEIVCGRLIQLNSMDLFMQEHPELGLCFYDLHNDGSGVYYSSRLRPIVNMQPGHIAHLGGQGSNVWQFNADTHLLAWLEESGYAFDIITDEDLEAEGDDALAGYRVVMTGTHPEYYSLGMLDSMQGYLDGGGRLMYMGGNGFYWRVSYHPDLPGVIECRKSEDGIRAFAPLPGEYHASFTGEYTGLWRRNGRAPNKLVGVGMVSQGFDVSASYVRTKDSDEPRAAFIFEGVEDRVIGDFGLCGGGAAGLELDAVSHDLGTPPHTLVLATSARHTDLYLMTPEDMNDPAPGLGGTEAEIIRADMVFCETPAAGAVFSTGSIAWAGSLSFNGYDNNVSRITGNVLNRFLENMPFEPADQSASPVELDECSDTD